MENIDLTNEENTIVTENGFYVKQVLGLYDYFTTLFSHISFYILGLLGCCIVFASIDSGLRGYFGIQIPTIIGTIIFYALYVLLFGGTLILYSYITYSYTIYESAMINQNQSIIINNQVYAHLENVPFGILLKSGQINMIGGYFLEFLRTPNFFGGIHRISQLRGVGYEIAIWIGLVSITLGFLIFSSFLFIIGIFLIFLLRYNIKLSYFLRIGLKIQNLTPQIATQSKVIQRNFASNINYQDLSKGFDGLASTFSQIVSLVIRLEKVEQKANKGNLFDSEKYISSLRGDIIGPLHSLQDFLVSKRTELIASQQGLSRVRVQVGGASENRDLQSARTDILLVELTQNIKKLDMMIGKME